MTATDRLPDDADDGFDFFEEWDRRDAAKARQRANWPTPRPLLAADASAAIRWANAGLGAELVKDRTATDGSRNEILNLACFRIGQLCGAGYLDDAAAVAEAFTEAGLSAGLTPSEVRGTVRSGLRAGMRKPRFHVPRDDHRWTVLDGEHVTETTAPDDGGPGRELRDTDEDGGPGRDLLDTDDGGLGRDLLDTDDGGLGRDLLDTDGVDDGFWQARPVLAHLHAFARSRGASPWAVLGVALVRALVAVPPRVVLPPLIGSTASLNCFLALVGIPGSGKGAARDAFIGEPEPFTASLGSGEGISHLFAARAKGGGVETIRRRALLIAPEVDGMAALLGRAGATLTATLRSAWSGERLGHANADLARTIPIPPHSYRLGLIVGAQPGRAGALLDGADGGMPQRFLWLRCTDPEAPRERPAEPGPLHWPVPHWPEDGSRCVLSVPDVAAQTIIAAQWARLRGQGEALDGHALLVREKVATALALLDGRTMPEVEDWELSGEVMVVSDATRAETLATLARRTRDANRARGEAEGERADIAGDVLAKKATARIATRILKRLHEAKGSVPRSEVRRWVAGRDRHLAVDAISNLIGAGLIVATEADGGMRLATAGGAS